MRENMRYAHFAEMCEKFENNKNMRKSRIFDIPNYCC